MSNLAKLGQMMVEASQGEGSWRKTALNHKIGNITIDTCDTPDCGWETGIERGSDSWVIVEEYDGEEEARKGHLKWIKAIKKTPKMKLEQCRTAEEWFDG